MDPGYEITDLVREKARDKAERSAKMDIKDRIMDQIEERIRDYVKVIVARNARNHISNDIEQTVRADILTLGIDKIQQLVAKEAINQIKGEISKHLEEKTTGYVQKEVNDQTHKVAKDMGLEGCILGYGEVRD